MDYHQTRRRSKRGGQRRRRALRDLPPGRAPVGFTVALDKFQQDSASSACKSTIRVIEEVKPPSDSNHTTSSDLTTPISKTADMFGPQARAAELQAMRSQVQRQKSHDNEEPPHPAPVSLTDFGRNVLQNRNKGNKTFRPLNLADINEDLAERDGNPPPLPRTDGPGPVLVQPNIAESPLTESETSPSSPLKAPPSAPKAMLRLALSPATFTKQIKEPGLHSTLIPSDKTGSSTVSCPKPTATATPRYNEYSSFGSPGSNLSPLNRNPLIQSKCTDFLFGLEKYCPSKPEEKQTALHSRFVQGYSEALQPTFTPSHQFYTSSNINSDIQYRTYQDSFSQNSYPTSFEFPYRLSQLRIPYLQEAQFTHQSKLILGSPHQQSDMLSNDLSYHDNNLRSLSQPISKLQYGGQCFNPTQQFEQPYDRSTKMQNFVAAQQAMAKTGKTVLHNPSIHRTPNKENLSVNNSLLQEEHNVQKLLHKTFPNGISPIKIPETLSSSTRLSIFASPHAKRSAPKCVERNVSQTHSIRREVKECPAILRAIKERDDPQSIACQPEMQHLKPEKAPPLPIVEYQPSSIEFPIDSEIDIKNWVNLLNTQQSRDLTQRVLRTVAAKQTTQHDITLIGNQEAVVGSKASDWMRSATLRVERHRNVEVIIDNYMEECVGNKPDFGIIGNPTERKENTHIRISAMKAIANAMATVEQYAAEGRQEGKSDRFIKVPEYAIDRAAFYNAEPSSVFDGVTKSSSSRRPRQGP